ARLGKSVTELRSAMPAMLNTPELRFQVDESRKFQAIEEDKQRLAQTDADVNDTDGVRVTTADGWWLLRASNTQDVLVARAESDTQQGLERLLVQIDEQLAASGLERGPQAGHWSPGPEGQNMLRWIAVPALVAASLALGACNTVTGLGQDIQSVVQAGQDAL